MRINHIHTKNNSPKGKIKELTIYHYLTNDSNSHSNSNRQSIKYKEFNMDELSDDDYILALHRKLAQKREIRKISEQGVKILDGRVRCLKDENRKTLAKIDLTRKKTREKLLALEYNKSRSKEKKDYLQKKEDELKLQKQKNMNQKLVIQANLINTKENLIMKNQIKGKISKAEKIDNENIKRENELNSKIIKKNKIEVLRNQTILNNHKKKILDIDKKEKLIKDLEKKINVEQQKKQELDDELSKLTAVENEIISRILQNTEMQRKLIEEFQKNFTNNEYSPSEVISLNNNIISCIKGFEQFDDYDDEDFEIK